MASFDLKPKEGSLLLTLMDERLMKGVGDPVMLKELGILRSRLAGFMGTGNRQPQESVERFLKEE